MSPLARKREWTVADFAEHMHLSHWQAKQRLLAIDREVGGMLLRPSRGKNRGFTFLKSALMKAKPELFEPIVVLTERVDEIEDKIGDMHIAQRMVAQQVGHNTRDIARLRADRRKAA